MKKATSLSAALFCLVWLTGATWLPLFQQASGGGAYVGPGDIVSGATVFYGLRAYNAASAGNKIANLCNSTGGTDVTCADAFSSASTGALVIPAGLVSICPGANCTVQTLYEQIGGGNCTPANCDMTQATIASRPVLTASCTPNNLACMSFVSSSSQNLGRGSNVFVTTINQPFSFSCVADRTGATGSTSGIFAGSGTNFNRQFSFDTTTRVFIFGGSANVNSGTVSNNAWHALQGVFNDPSNSLVNVDGSSGTPGSGGTDNYTGPFAIGQDGFSDFLTGNITECGSWPIAFSSGQMTSMYGNQHTYWGF